MLGEPKERNILILGVNPSTAKPGMDDPHKSIAIIKSPAVHENGRAFDYVRTSCLEEKVHFSKDVAIILVAGVVDGFAAKIIGAAYDVFGERVGKAGFPASNGAGVINHRNDIVCRMQCRILSEMPVIYCNTERSGIICPRALVVKREDICLPVFAGDIPAGIFRVGGGQTYIGREFISDPCSPDAGVIVPVQVLQITGVFQMMVPHAPCKSLRPVVINFNRLVTDGVRSPGGRSKITISIQIVAADG